MTNLTRVPRGAAALLLVLVLLGCSREDDMADQPRHEPMDTSDFFADGQSARPFVAGTVPRAGRPFAEDSYAMNANSAERSARTEFPAPLTPADLTRGHERYDIYCSTCHGRLGDGNGMIVQRGFPRPPSFYTQRLREAPPGHYYDVITNGYGAMFSYNDRVSPDDRWRIAAYIKALQMSTDAVDPDTRAPQAAAVPDN